ncbi:MAG: hypothetical protein ACK4GJ_05895 [bacterium]
MREINNIGGNFEKIKDRGFVNYFPNYLKNESQENIKDSFLLNPAIKEQEEEFLSVDNSNNSEKTEKSAANNSSSVPVNLFMEEKNIEVRSKNYLFGPTNLPSKVEEMYINPRYL